MLAPDARCSSGLIIAGLLAWNGGAEPAAANNIAATVTAKTNCWKYNVSAALKETFDSNIYLQSVTPSADQDSLVTSFQPQMSLNWQPGSDFAANLNYAPECVVFHSGSRENFLAHRANLAAAGKLADTRIELKASLVLIDGEAVGPTWTGPGGAPATGGPAIRDRRDATVYRSSFSLTRNLGNWLLRPALNFYLHDFRTDHRATPGYQNYVDRNEIVAGLDVGIVGKEKLSAWVGYRFGRQDQAQLLAFPEEYDNTFHRVCLGLEGGLARWCKVSITVGPEFRHYGNRVPAAFGGRNKTRFYADTTATLTPTARDTFTLSFKHFEQPGFGGRSIYSDLTGDLNWKHKFNQRWTFGLGGRAYNTDFHAPVVRDDWVLSASVFLNFAANARWNFEGSYAYEEGLSQDVNTAGREYDRHLVALGVRYTFH